jgi:hypothetical protein
MTTSSSCQRLTGDGHEQQSGSEAEAGWDDGPLASQLICHKRSRHYSNQSNHRHQRIQQPCKNVSSPVSCCLKFKVRSLNLLLYFNKESDHGRPPVSTTVPFVAAMSKDEMGCFQSATNVSKAGEVSYCFYFFTLATKLVQYVPCI